MEETGTKESTNSKSKKRTAGWILCGICSCCGNCIRTVPYATILTLILAILGTSFASGGIEEIFVALESGVSDADFQPIKDLCIFIVSFALIVDLVTAILNLFSTGKFREWICAKSLAVSAIGGVLYIIFYTVVYLTMLLNVLLLPVAAIVLLLKIMIDVACEAAKAASEGVCASFSQFGGRDYECGSNDLTEFCDRWASVTGALVIFIIGAFILIIAQVNMLTIITANFIRIRHRTGKKKKSKEEEEEANEMDLPDWKEDSEAET